MAECTPAPAAAHPAAPAVPARAGDVVARDHAILAHLAKGPAIDAVLRAVLPREDGQTDAQRDQALANALMRLQLKNRIRQTDEGWVLV